MVANFISDKHVLSAVVTIKLIGERAEEAVAVRLHFLDGVALRLEGCAELSVVYCSVGSAT